MPRPRRVCQVCGGKHYGRGFCEMHYYNLRRGGLIRPEERVSAAPVARRIELLHGIFGWPYETIARRLHVNEDRLQRIRNGECETVPKRKAAAVLALPLEYQNTRIPVPFLGTQRRLDALAFRGWSPQAVARALGLYQRTFFQVGRRSSGRVKACTALAVDQFFKENADRPGPDRSYATRARKRGAIPAAAWEGLDIDDPNVQPWGHIPDRRSGAARKVYVDDIEHLRGYHMNDADIARHLHVTPTYIREVERRARESEQPPEEAAS